MIEFFLTEASKVIPPINGVVTLLESNAGTSLSGSMCAVLGDNFYLAGGRDTAGATNTFKRYNLVERKWYDLAPLPTVRAAGQLLASNGMLYLFGGYSTTSSTYPPAMYAYNPTTNTWTTLSNSPNNGRSWLGGVSLNGRLYFFGGWIGSQLRTVEVYNPLNDTWGGLKALGESRHGHMCAVHGGQVYIYGGLTGGGATVSNDVIRFTVGDQSYANVGLGTRPTKRCYGMMLSAFNKLYVFGGYTDGNGTDSLNDFWESNKTADSWSTVTLTGATLTKRAVFGYGIWRNQIHVIFGQAAGSGSNIYRTDHLMIE